MTLRVRLLLGLVVLTAIGLDGRRRRHVSRDSRRSCRTASTSSSRRPSRIPTSSFAAVANDGADDAASTRPAVRHLRPRSALDDGATQIAQHRPRSRRQAKPNLPATVTLGHDLHGRITRSYRVLAATACTIGPGRFAPSPATLDRRDPARATSNDTLHHLLLVELIVTLGSAARRSRSRVVGRQARAATARAHAARPRARSRPATSRAASTSPTSTPRSGGSASRSTR